MAKEKFFLKDWKHWFGWVISAAAIDTAVMFYLKYANDHITTKIALTTFGVIFVAEVVVDAIKHFTKLQ